MNTFLWRLGVTVLFVILSISICRNESRINKAESRIESIMRIEGITITEVESEVEP